MPTSSFYDVLLLDLVCERLLPSLTVNSTVASVLVGVPGVLGRI